MLLRETCKEPLNGGHYIGLKLALLCTNRTIVLNFLLFEIIQIYIK